MATETVSAFLEKAGGRETRLVVIPTAAEEPDLVEAVGFWKRRGIAAVTVLHTRDRAVADREEFIAPLKTATAVWIGGGLQTRLERAYIGTATEAAVLAMLERGGCIGGSSAGAAFLCRDMIRSGLPEPVMGTGLDALPYAIIDQHFTQRKRQPRLQAALAAHSQRVGYGIDEGTALHIEGREFSITGSGHVYVYLPEGAQRKARQFRLNAGRPGDHLALARAAISRSGPQFPPAEPEASVVEAGTLVMVGGGPLPKSAFRAFMAAAGGMDARIIMITTAQSRQQQAIAASPELFAELGATNLKVMHLKDRAAADEPASTKVIDEATGIWFTGGRQWRLADRYLGTGIETAIHRLMARGGVVGGSSAGASFCTEFLVRGNPLQARTPYAEGYDRGLGLLPGAAIDQHIRQRNRLPDLLLLKRKFPQLLIIGLDEATAAIVTGDTLKVSGLGSAYLLDQPISAPRPKAGEHFTVLERGDRYDLKERKTSFRWPKAD